MPADLTAPSVTEPHRPASRGRRLLVVWQNPDTRQFVHVGHLDQRADGDYEFAYEPGAAHVEGFGGFAAFPELERSYRSSQLFPFFTNRVMSVRRPEYGSYVEALGFDRGEPTPVEILARSGGGRATDTVHVVAEPQRLDDGRETLLFLASGIRHIDGVDARLRRLSAGDRLSLRHDVDNEFNARALLLDNATGEEVGWVPDYLLDLVHTYRAECAVGVTVERVNSPDVPPHLRLLCRLETGSSRGRA